MIRLITVVSSHCGKNSVSMAELLPKKKLHGGALSGLSDGGGNQWKAKEQFTFLCTFFFPHLLP